MATYWITKYALSDGIKEMEFGPDCIKENGRISRIDDNPWVHHYYGKNDYSTTKTAAIVRANQMREAKIASLKKQITKLDKMKF